MEPDRYKNNHTVFIIGMISLLLSLSLLAFSFYILPFLLFGWQYDVPGFILFWRESLQTDYSLSSTLSCRLILLFYFGLACIFSLITYFSSNRIDDQIYRDEIKKTGGSAKHGGKTHEGLHVSLTIGLFIFIIILLASFVQWAFLNS